MTLPTPNQPPRLRSRRMAVTLNLLLPGLGQLYLGRRALGGVFLTAFLACAVALLAIFLHGYVAYFELATGSELMEGDNLERIGQIFHPAWLIGLLAVALAIYFASLLALAMGPRTGKS